VLERVIQQRGKAAVIRVDNGPEYTSKDFELWAREEHISIQYIQPGRPMQNGYIERFNGRYRRDVLDAYIFFEIYEVRQLTHTWIEEYNTCRPHESLGNATPREWAQRYPNFEMTLKQNCKMTREELIELVKKISAAEGTEEEINNMLSLLKKNVPDPRVSNYIYWDDLTPEEVVDKALKYKPIQL